MLGRKGFNIGWRRCSTKKHEQAIDRINRKRAGRTPFQVGDKVWVYKHKKVGGYKLDTRWWGPAEILRRVGQSSYVVGWEGGEQEVHVDDLKLYEVEEFREEGVELWYMEEPREGERPDKGDTPVERVIAHRRGSRGITEFLVKWVGWDKEFNTWEPAYNFTRCCQPWVDYCKMYDLKFPINELVEEG